MIQFKKENNHAQNRIATRRNFHHAADNGKDGFSDIDIINPFF
jgi:hypothetical protein